MSSPAIAQDATQAAADASADSQDIIVTAQKRSESIQNVPMAITAMSGDSLEARAINDVASLASSVPNMTFGSYGGSAKIAIRGIGLVSTIGVGDEGRIAYHLDGVYISRPAATIGTFFDVDRIEVLRGPQGTLYGRNATGGSINVVPNGPTADFSGYVRVGYGNYSDLTTEGAVGGPLSDDVGFRVAFMTRDRDGYGKNIVTGSEIDNARQRGVRATLAVRLGDLGKLSLSGDYYNENDRNYAAHYMGQGNLAVTPVGLRAGGVVAASRRDIASDFDPSNDRTFWGMTANAEFELGSATLRSVTGYRNSKFANHIDLDLTSAPVAEAFYTERAEQISQELQLAGEIGGAQYVFGAYYFDERVKGGTRIPLSGPLLFGAPSRYVQGSVVYGDLHTKSFAGFGQIDYDVADRLTLTLGGRYSWERKSIVDLNQFDATRPFPPALPYLPRFSRDAHKSSTAFTPKIAVEYRPRERLLFYASASKGFKSGGYNVGDLNSPDGFEPEKIWAYEVGLKGSFADGLVQINASGFYYDYKELQVTQVVGTVVTVNNAASSTIYGGEAQFIVTPAEGFQLEVSPTWLHAKYNDFQTANPATPGNTTPIILDGNPLPQSPAVTLNLASEYSRDVGSGSLTLRGEVNFQDRTFYTPFRDKALSREPTTLFNAFLTYKTDRWDVSVYGRNLAGKEAMAYGVVGAALFGLPIIGSLEAPRTFGIRLGYGF